MDIQPARLGKQLRWERESRHWTQDQLAQKIDGSIPSINRWEHGRAIPRPDTLNLLAQIFGKSPEYWGPSRHVFSNIPFSRNLHFTGREQILLRLHNTLAADNIVALSQARAISGLGGIGKTQTALEYAYRYNNEYEAVLWVGADSHESLLSNFAALATVLNLPEKKWADREQMRTVVKRWLEGHSPWLMIFDNADDLSLVADFLPRRPGGAVLLTTRSQDTGLSIKKIELEPMSCEEGVTFLLQYIASSKGEDEEGLPKKISNSEQAIAEEIWKLMGGLPLALDQAAAYIGENQSNLMDYLSLYQLRRDVLLQRRGSLRQKDYPASVATTWLLSFQQVEQANPAAADLLRLCSFLHPDAIPEEMIVANTLDLGPNLSIAAHDQLLWDGIIGILQKYSLIRRNPETKTLRIHRLVQTVLQDMLTETIRHMWAVRTLLAINAAFPHPEYNTWPQCERLLPHALSAASYIETDQITSEEAGHLLYEVAFYLQKRVRYQEAELLYQQALRIREQQLGPEHPEVATVLNNLANLYLDQGKYVKAEPLYLRALRIFEQQLGPEHPEVATVLNGLAVLFYGQGKYVEAEPLYLRALRIREQQLGPEHPDGVYPLIGLAILYYTQGKYVEAEPLYLRALRISEQQLGPDHPNVAALNNLADLYRAQSKYAEAEPLYLRGLHISEQQFGFEHPYVTSPLSGLAALYRAQGKYAEAEPLYLRALRISERQLGSDHPETADIMYGLAQLREAQDNLEEARAWYKQALETYEQALGTQHPKTRETHQRFIDLFQAMEGSVRTENPEVGL